MNQEALWHCTFKPYHDNHQTSVCRQICTRWSAFPSR